MGYIMVLFIAGLLAIHKNFMKLLKWMGQILSTVI